MKINNVAQFALAYLKKNEKYAMVLIFLATLLIRLAYFFVMGIADANDHEYLNAAKVINENGFNIFSLRNTNLPIYYWLYPFIISFFGKGLFWVIVFQIFIQGIGSILIYKITKNLFGFMAGIFAGISYGFLWELFQWDIYILTDSMFIFYLVVLLCAAIIAKEKNKPRYWVTYFIILAMGLLLRPTILPIVASSLLFLIWNLKRDKKVIIIGLFLIFVLGGLFLVIPSSLNSRLGPGGNFLHFVDLYKRGIVINDRPEFTVLAQWDNYFSFKNFFLFLKITLLRLLFFWTPYTKNFSSAHNVLGFLSLAPLYLLGCYGFAKALYTRKEIRVVVYLLSSILFIWFFHSVTEIDFDWRYRLPIFPFVIIMSSYGAVSVINRIKTKDEYSEISNS